MDTEKKCKNCIFWVKFERAIPGTIPTLRFRENDKGEEVYYYDPPAMETVGECHGGPPSIDPNDYRNIEWPVTKPDDWCGAFKNHEGVLTCKAVEKLKKGQMVKVVKEEQNEK